MLGRNITQHAKSFKAGSDLARGRPEALPSAEARFCVGVSEERRVGALTLFDSRPLPMHFLRPPPQMTDLLRAAVCAHAKKASSPREARKGLKPSDVSTPRHSDTPTPPSALRRAAGRERRAVGFAFSLFIRGEWFYFRAMKQQVLFFAL